MWGLEDREAECGDEAVGTEVRLPSSRATLWLHWRLDLGKGVSGVSSAEPTVEYG